MSGWDLQDRQGQSDQLVQRALVLRLVRQDQEPRQLLQARQGRPHQLGRQVLSDQWDRLARRDPVLLPVPQDQRDQARRQDQLVLVFR